MEAFAALVDSLVLHSGYSSIRLESFLFTKESFQDVRRVLKPTGGAEVLVGGARPTVPTGWDHFAG